MSKRVNYCNLTTLISSYTQSSSQYSPKCIPQRSPQSSPVKYSMYCNGNTSVVNACSLDLDYMNFNLNWNNLTNDLYWISSTTTHEQTRHWIIPLTTRRFIRLWPLYTHLQCTHILWIKYVYRSNNKKIQICYFHAISWFSMLYVVLRTYIKYTYSLTLDAWIQITHDFVCCWSKLHWNVCNWCQVMRSIKRSTNMSSSSMSI